MQAAVGKVSIRFVPDQSASQLVDLLTAHVRHEFAKLRSPNSVAVEVHVAPDARAGQPIFVAVEAAIKWRRDRVGMGPPGRRWLVFLFLRHKVEMLDGGDKLCELVALLLVERLVVGLGLQQQLRFL